MQIDGSPILSLTLVQLPHTQNNPVHPQHLAVFTAPWASVFPSPPPSTNRNKIVSRTQQLELAGRRKEQEDNVFRDYRTSWEGEFIQFHKLIEPENRLGVHRGNNVSVNTKFAGISFRDWWAVAGSHLPCNFYPWAKCGTWARCSKEMWSSNAFAMLPARAAKGWCVIMHVAVKTKEGGVQRRKQFYKFPAGPTELWL